MPIGKRLIARKSNNAEITNNAPLITDYLNFESEMNQKS